MLTRLSLCVLLLFVPWAIQTKQSSSPAPLAGAIDDFNAMASKHPIGKSQPPLTQEEVIAAIMLAEKQQFPEASQRDFERFKAIARTKAIPADGEFEILDGLDRGGDFIFDVWYVRIRLDKGDGGNYAFTIRERVIRARPVSEVADELEKKLADIPPLPGRYRIEDRVNDLKARAARAGTRPE